MKNFEYIQELEEFEASNKCGIKFVQALDLVTDMEEHIHNAGMIRSQIENNRLKS